MVQCFAMRGLVTILWAVIGYSLAFGHATHLWEDSSTSFCAAWGWGHRRMQARSRHSMVYQLMFAIITPALITGAFAERMKFSAMALFLALWSLLVYSPMAHTVGALADC